MPNGRLPIVVRDVGVPQAQPRLARRVAAVLHAVAAGSIPRVGRVITVCAGRTPVGLLVALSRWSRTACPICPVSLPVSLLVVLLSPRRVPERLVCRIQERHSALGIGIV